MSRSTGDRKRVCSNERKSSAEATTSAEFMGAKVLPLVLPDVRRELRLEAGEDARSMNGSGDTPLHTQCGESPELARQIDHAEEDESGTHPAHTADTRKTTGTAARG